MKVHRFPIAAIAEAQPVPPNVTNHDSRRGVRKVLDSLPIRCAFNAPMRQLVALRVRNARRRRRAGSRVAAGRRAGRPMSIHTESAAPHAWTESPGAIQSRHEATEFHRQERIGMRCRAALQSITIMSTSSFCQSRIAALSATLLSDPMRHVLQDSRRRLPTHGHVQVADVVG